MKPIYIKNIMNELFIFQEDREKLLRLSNEILDECVKQYSNVEYCVDEIYVPYIQEYILGNSLKGTVRDINGKIKNYKRLSKILLNNNIPFHNEIIDKKLHNLKFTLSFCKKKYIKYKKEERTFDEKYLDIIVELKNNKKTNDFIFTVLKSKNKTITKSQFNRILLRNNLIEDNTIRKHNSDLTYLDKYHKKEILSLWYQEDPVLSLNDITYIISNKCNVGKKTILFYIENVLKLRSNEKRANVVRKRKSSNPNTNPSFRIKVEALEAIQNSRYKNIKNLVNEYNKNCLLSTDKIIQNIKEDTDIEISSSQLYTRMTECDNYVKRQSLEEGRFGILLKNAFKDYVIEEHNRQIISPMEIDYYIPELHIGFEFNGDYWHSTKIIQQNYQCTAREYHLKKKQKAKEHNVDLFYVWESDFVRMPDVIYEILKNRNFSHELINKLENETIKLGNKKYRKVYKKAKDVQLGDKVISRGNLISDVIAKSEIHTPNKAYKIILEDGTEQIASDDHLWPVFIDEEYSRKVLEILLKVDTHHPLSEDIYELMKNFAPADYFNKEFNRYEWSDELFKKHLMKIQETKELEWRLNTETIYEKFQNHEKLYLIHNQQGKKLIKDAIEVEPEKSVCITVNDNDRVFELENGLLTGNSVLLNNIENACLLRPDKWLLMICDMKRVEGSRFMQFGVPVGTTYESCAKILQFAQKVMMDRYDLMVKYGVNDYDDLPQEQQAQAIMVIVDEAAELFAPITGKDDVAKENAEYQAAALQATESIYRLGRAAKVHVMTFAQRPSSSDSGISMTIRQNASTRIGCGRLP